ncbi:hypothetical protein MLD38_012659 [Melastoma candidum]|nr:hypothetical protein MLD38_012659 [Melastoma candidum]
MLSSPGFQHLGRLGFPQPKDETLMFLHSHSSENRMGEMMNNDPDHDIKWPNGLSFFTALTGRSEDEKLLFNHDGLPKKPDPDQAHVSPPFLDRKSLNSDSSSMRPDHIVSDPNEFLSLDRHPDSSRKVDKYKRSFTTPARVTPSSTSSADQGQPSGYMNSETGMYPDMETFME